MTTNPNDPINLSDKTTFEQPLQGYTKREDMAKAAMEVHRKIPRMSRLSVPYHLRNHYRFRSDLQ